MLKKILTVEGMHCEHCASSVEKAVAQINGVIEAKVNLSKKTCSAKIKEDMDNSVFINAVKEAGFEVIGCETKKTIF